MERGLSCSSDRTIRVWDLSAGTEIERQRMEGHTDWVMSCCVFTLDGEWRALSTSRDKTMKFWDLESDTEKCLYTYTGHQDMIGGCEVYLEDGSNWRQCGAAGATGEADRALTCSDDKTLRVWDLRTHGCRHTLAGHTGIVIGCCVFRDQLKDRQFGVSCSADGTLRIWDLVDGKCERVMEDPDQKSRVRGCGAFSDGSKIISCSGNILRVWDRDLLIKTEPVLQDQAMTMQVFIPLQLNLSCIRVSHCCYRCFCRTAHTWSGSGGSTCSYTSTRRGPRN